MVQEDAAAPAIAAFVYRRHEEASPLLAEVVRQLRLRGVALAGAIQHNEGQGKMLLELLPLERRMTISQPLAVAGTCKLDTYALADAAALVRQAIDAGPQLAIINKFGAQEAAGAGLCAEMAAAVLSGIPLLTAVSETVLSQWTAFTGGCDVRLAHAPEAALAWWDGLQR
ncbi:DUF2478 domain-containing protein [Noviherbaspirillum denitrificans]|uniref:Molybdenum ABC transporter ATP-binding protein n=1 Tax=Noviherbaspirillum denitrificans TaxID=1968433 RepID=A0A254TCG2_9BURK|nr:DUF2478 domain-containing protein [Noviherbaspirillum denitrificans]OWW20324.1 hypothetical protein AYR66_13295 [Noviherbaspirillum denitrificans]